MATKIQSPKIMKIETIQMQWPKYDQFQKKSWDWVDSVDLGLNPYDKKY
jgi:hypothetical protein